MEDWIGYGITQEHFEECVRDYVDSWDHPKFTWKEMMEFAKDKLGVNNGES
jgi:hypothetical protein